MNATIKQILLTILFIFFSYNAFADKSEGCKSCIRSYDCSRINKVCNATCRANLFSKSIDLDSCRAHCIGKLEKCLHSADKSCGFYCEEN